MSDYYRMPVGRLEAKHPDTGEPIFTAEQREHLIENKIVSLTRWVREAVGRAPAWTEVTRTLDEDNPADGYLTHVVAHMTHPAIERQT